MTRRPTRATTAGRAYLDLRRLARQCSSPTEELLQLFALEGFLARLSASPHASRLVLKGGMLLAAFDARRPTKDVDLAATALRNDTETVHAAVQAVVEIDLDDGLEFEPGKTSAQVIRDHDDYSGVRVTIPCRLASAKLDFHVDVNVGDPIWPGPTNVTIPRILGGEPLVVAGYPVPMVLAEKTVTAIQRGSANTRWRDFTDVVILCRRQALDAQELRRAIEVVADHRRVALRSLESVLPGFATEAQPKWAAWRRRSQLEESTPSSFAILLSEIFTFIDPILGSDELDATWDPPTAAWKSVR